VYAIDPGLRRTGGAMPAIGLRTFRFGHVSDQAVAEIV
jgi:hypothetical protein